VNILQRLLRACATNYGSRNLIAIKVLRRLQPEQWSDFARAVLDLEILSVAGSSEVTSTIVNELPNDSAMTVNGGAAALCLSQIGAAQFKCLEQNLRKQVTFLVNERLDSSA